VGKSAYELAVSLAARVVMPRSTALALRRFPHPARRDPGVAAVPDQTISGSVGALRYSRSDLDRFSGNPPYRGVRSFPMARDGDGLYRRHCIWIFKYKDRNGIYREKSPGKPKLSEAREYKHSFLEKLLQNQLRRRSKWTFDQALAKWMEFRSATRPKESVSAERTSCRHLKNVIGAERRLNSLTSWDIPRFQMKPYGQNTRIR
jgi:hypothetical protein